MNQKGKLYNENVPKISKENSLEICSCYIHLTEIFMITRPRLQYGQRSVHCGYLTHIHLKERQESWDLEGGAQQSSACWLELFDLKKVKRKNEPNFLEKNIYMVYYEVLCDQQKCCSTSGSTPVIKKQSVGQLLRYSGIVLPGVLRETIFVHWEWSWHDVYSWYITSNRHSGSTPSTFIFGLWEYSRKA